MRPHVIAVIMALLWPASGAAQDKSFRLAIPVALAESGLPAHLLPRFSLKTGVRILAVEPQDPSDAAFAETGTARPVFEGVGTGWHYVDARTNEFAGLFGDWLGSGPGRAAIEGFAPNGVQAFRLPAAQAAVVAAAIYEGDAAAGADLSLALCGRCHVVGEVNRMNAIGSAPSFAGLRAMADWDRRFQTFYILRPHPAFTQVAGITPPFDPARPSPIAPVEMSLDDLEAILAFVSGIPPADLGAAIQLQ